MCVERIYKNTNKFDKFNSVNAILSDTDIVVDYVSEQHRVISRTIIDKWSKHFGNIDLIKKLILARGLRYVWECYKFQQKHNLWFIVCNWERFDNVLDDGYNKWSFAVKTTQRVCRRMMVHWDAIQGIFLRHSEQHFFYQTPRKPTKVTHIDYPLTPDLLEGLEKLPQ